MKKASKFFSSLIKGYGFVLKSELIALGILWVFVMVVMALKQGL